MTSPPPPVVAGLCAVAALVVYAPLPFVAPSQLFAQGGDASTWFLAEGANNATFSQEILVGNPGAQAVDVTVTLLPQPDAIVAQTAKTYRLAGTSRLTVRLGQEFGLNGSASARIRAVAAGTTTPAPIVVERTMYFPGASNSGAHSASGVMTLAPAWTLAEGATTIFDTFVLVANPNPSPTLVQATYLTAEGAEYLSEQIGSAGWTHHVLAAAGACEPAGVGVLHTRALAHDWSDVVAERAMYFDGFRGGHDALGVTTPSTTWYFAEGSTGGNTQTAFETFLLLANGGSTPAQATVDYRRFAIFLESVAGRHLRRHRRAAVRRRARVVRGQRVRGGARQYRSRVVRGHRHAAIAARRGRIPRSPSAGPSLGRCSVSATTDETFMEFAVAIGSGQSAC